MTARPQARSPTWPAAEAARYRALGLWIGETFGGFLRERATRFASRTAVVGPGAQRWSYAELDARADAVASGLVALGIAPGDRVVVQLPNSAAYAELLFGLWRAGALPVFALPAHRRSELEAVCAAAEATAIVTVHRHAGFDHAGLAAQLRGAVASLRCVVLAEELDALRIPGPPPAADAEPGAVALLQLSGGTTSNQPKLIPRTADDYLYSARESAAICGLSESSVFLAALPAAHNFTMSSPGILGTLHAGGTVVFAPAPDPETCFSLIAREQVTITALVPPLLLAWLDARPASRHDLTSLELLQVGGAKLAPEAARRVRPAFDCTLQQVFGMAEGLVSYTRLDDPEELICTSQGRPISDHDELRIVGADGTPVADGEAGMLETRGPYTIRGYYADAAPAAFTADGFYRTGDVVRRLGSGHLVVEGRAKDQINRGGEKIAPDEIEDHLLAHPQIHDAALVAIPDGRLGELTCAVLVARGTPPTSAEIRRFLRERGLAAFKLPDRVQTVDAFPQTGVGKVSRRELRAAIAATLLPRPKEQR